MASAALFGAIVGQLVGVCVYVYVCVYVLVRNVVSKNDIAGAWNGSMDRY